MLDKYDIIDTLQKNNRIEVSLAINKKSEKKIIKKFNRTYKTDISANFKNEYTILTSLEHSHIPKLEEYWEDDDYYYLVLKYIPGENLFQLLEENSTKPLSEKRIKKIMFKLIQIVLYCHKKNIVHHDLKLENIIISGNEIFLIDFEMAEYVGNDGLSESFCGSIDYVSPEILNKNKYSGFKADCWSLGVIFYALVYNQFPFHHKKRTQNISKGKEHPIVKFPTDKNNSISKNAIDLLSLMLMNEPSHRIQLENTIRHAWFAEYHHKCIII